MAKRTTDDQLQEIITMHNNGMYWSHIAKATGRSEACIHHNLTKLGYKSKRSHLSEEEKNKIILFHACGVSNREIASQINRSAQAVSDYLKLMGKLSHGNGRSLLNERSDRAFCMLCKEWKGLRQFNSKLIFHTKCNKCRNLKNMETINNSIESYMKRSISVIKARCKKEGMLFDIDYEYLLDISFFQNDKCFLTGEPLEYKTGNGYNPLGCSVDKVVPQKGYVKGNIILIQRKINMRKNNSTLPEIKRDMPPWYDRIMEAYEKGVLY